VTFYDLYSSDSDSSPTLELVIQLCIQLRNLSTVAISSLFCLWARHSKDLLDQTAYEQGADRAHPDTILDDFQMVLVSLIPYKHFQRYIN
jgi:hypothetical protein